MQHIQYIRGGGYVRCACGLHLDGIRTIFRKILLYSHIEILHTRRMERTIGIDCYSRLVPTSQQFTSLSCVDNIYIHLFWL